MGETNTARRPTKSCALKTCSTAPKALSVEDSKPEVEMPGANMVGRQVSSAMAKSRVLYLQTFGTRATLSASADYPCNRALRGLAIDVAKREILLGIVPTNPRRQKYLNNVDLRRSQ